MMMLYIENKQATRRRQCQVILLTWRKYLWRGSGYVAELRQTLI
jgi:hypothetical protein